MLCASQKILTWTFKIELNSCLLLHFQMAKIRGSSQSQGARGGKTKKKVMPINFEDQIEADRENFSSNLSPLWGGGTTCGRRRGREEEATQPSVYGSV